jgi:hypothetical protein
MSHFTQLGLSGTPEEQPQGKNISNSGQRPTLDDNSFRGKQKAAAFLSWLIVTSLLGVALLDSGGCSKGERKSVSLEPGSPAAYTPQPASPSAATYTNPAYGISFQYPNYGGLKEGDHTNLQWAELGPVEMNFVENGGTTLAAVELPGSLYPSTDFTAAFFKVSVNSQLTSAQCEQFAFPGQTASPDHREGSTEIASNTELSVVKLGSAEFTEVEESGNADTNQADTKYYHVYQNGACYEFVLGMDTAAGDAAGGTKPVNRNEVFRKLNWILSTVKIIPAGVPATPSEITAHRSAAAPATTADGSKN